MSRFAAARLSAKNSKDTKRDQGRGISTDCADFADLECGNLRHLSFFAFQSRASAQSADISSSSFRAVLALRYRDAPSVLWMV